MAMADRPLAVTMAIQAFSPVVGGGELQLERLLAPLAARDVHARVVTRAVPGTRRRDLVRGSDIVRTRIAGESPAASIAYVGGALAGIVGRRRCTDVVHAHGALSPATIALGASFAGVPAVVTPLGAGAPGDLARVRRKPGGEWRLRQLARRAHFVALSDELAAELRAFGAPAARVHCVPNGFDARVFRPPAEAERARARDAVGIARDRCCFVFVGRLHPVKQLDVVVRALASVPDSDLVVVGDGPEHRSLAALAREVGVGDRVHFVGARDDVVTYLHAADAFVLPSQAEGMSNALVEAMACALPCLVTASISGTGGLVAGGRGLPVAGGDTGAWSRAMGAVQRDPVAAGRAGALASAHVHATFSLDRTADRLAALYREVARR
jgi:glycosyltransferase involved in cell wall biosynthesis